MSANQWVADRVPSERVLLDVAGAGRVSTGVLAAEIAHLQREATDGPYVAEAAAHPAIDAGREAVGALVGLSGADVLLRDGATAAFATMLEAWPLRNGARIGIVPSEFGSNALLLARLAARRGWDLVPLPLDEQGRVVDVPVGLDLLTLPQVPSQRGILQPAADLIASGTPVLLDVAQALGQVEVPAGAAAYVGTSRTWLCGPRGVGFGVVGAGWRERLEVPPTLNGVELSGAKRWDSTDQHVAGRVGFALAVRTWSPAVLGVALAAAGAARVLLEGAGGWRVVEPFDEPTAITTLTHATADVVATKDALVELGFVTSAIPISRAADLNGPVLRVSTAAWVTPDDLEGLAAALDSL